METNKFYVETKIINKVLAYRVDRILKTLISNKQNAFVGGRNIG